MTTHVAPKTFEPAVVYMQLLSSHFVDDVYSQWYPESSVIKVFGF